MKRSVTIELPEGALGGWDVLVAAFETAREKTGFRLIFGGLIEQIKSQSRPDEPTGLGAVVEAINDNHFVRVATGDHPWQRVSDVDGEYLCQWDEIDVVRVLSDGVTS